MNYPRVGIGILIFNEHNQVLLGKRTGSHGLHTWGPPGGHLEFGETFEECAMRETKEETGLDISHPQLIGFTNDIFEDEDKHYVSVFLKASLPPYQQVSNCEPHKILEWGWFCLNNLPSPLFLPLKNFLQQAGSFKF